MCRPFAESWTGAKSAAEDEVGTDKPGMAPGGNAGVGDCNGEGTEHALEIDGAVGIDWTCDDLP